jgi:hypothetical protein
MKMGYRYIIPGEDIWGNDFCFIKKDACWMARLREIHAGLLEGQQLAIAVFGDGDWRDDAVRVTLSSRDKFPDASQWNAMMTKFVEGCHVGDVGREIQMARMMCEGVMYECERFPRFGGKAREEAIRKIHDNISRVVEILKNIHL